MGFFSFALTHFKAHIITGVFYAEINEDVFINFCVKYTRCGMQSFLSSNTVHI